MWREGSNHDTWTLGRTTTQRDICQVQMCQVCSKGETQKDMIPPADLWCDWGEAHKLQMRRSIWILLQQEDMELQEEQQQQLQCSMFVVIIQCRDVGYLLVN